MIGDLQPDLDLCFSSYICVEKAERRPNSDSNPALELPLGAFDVGFACYSDPDVEQQTELALQAAPQPNPCPRVEPQSQSTPDEAGPTSGLETRTSSN